jgi:hypothetical protein
MASPATSAESHTIHPFFIYHFTGPLLLNIMFSSMYFLAFALVFAFLDALIMFET